MNETERIIEHLQVQLRIATHHLYQAAESLKDRMQWVCANTHPDKPPKYTNLNSEGEIQALGSRVDVLVSRVKQIDRTIRYIRDGDDY